MLLERGRERYRRRLREVLGCNIVTRGRLSPCGVPKREGPSELFQVGPGSYSPSLTSLVELSMGRGDGIIGGRSLPPRTISGDVLKLRAGSWQLCSWGHKHLRQSR